MFTGLVEDRGEIVATRPDRGGVELTIRTRIPLSDVRIGDSIAVDGVCLTVETVRGDAFTATAGPETLRLTTIGGLGAGSGVHLERALAVGDRLGGHLVQGHVDGTGPVTQATDDAGARVLWIDAGDLSRYVATKGSICVDGVSLTVNEVEGTRFRVNLVPHTLAVTKMGALRAGDRVNLEVDVLARYVERLLGAAGPGKGLSLETLVRAGFA